MQPNLTAKPGAAHGRGSEQPLFDGIGLVRSRVHEFCGQARRSLALMLAGRMEGPVFWIRPGWSTEKLLGEGMTAFADPGRFTFIDPAQDRDTLWCMEEVLRSGLVPLVVADLPGPPALTPVRRLHLAAETGTGETRMKGLGVLLCPGPGGAPGVESRWQLDPAHSAGQTGWHLTRLRARTAPPAEWQVDGQLSVTPSPRSTEGEETIFKMKIGLKSQ